MKKNEILYFFGTLFYQVSFLLIGGAYLQTFMLESGIEEQSVQNFVSSMQIIQIIMMVIFSKKIENVKNVIHTSTLLRFLQLLMFIPMLYLCFSGTLEILNKYIIIFVFGIVFNIVLGLYNVLSYKLPYHIMDIKRYGFVLSSSEGIAGIGTFVFSLIVSYFLKQGEYFLVMTVVYVSGAICLIVSGIIMTGYKQVGSFLEYKTETKKINLFKYKPFYYLIIPNLLRGYCFGIFNIAVSIGYYFGILDKLTAGYLVVITTAVSIISSFLYSLLSVKNIEKEVILFSSVIVAVSLPLMLVGKNITAFLLFYFIGFLALNMINISVPVFITKFVDYEVIGQYTALRMMLHTLGISLAGFSCTYLFNFIGGVPSMLVFGIMQFLSGLAYYNCIKIKNKQE